MTGGDEQKRKRIIIISVSTFLLVAMVVAVTIGVSYNMNGTNDDAANAATNPTYLPQ